MDKIKRTVMPLRAWWRSSSAVTHGHVWAAWSGGQIPSEGPAVPTMCSRTSPGLRMRSRGRPTS